MRDIYKTKAVENSTRASTSQGQRDLKLAKLASKFSIYLLIRPALQEGPASTSLPFFYLYCRIPHHQGVKNPFTPAMDTFTNATKMVQPPHPFYPLEANIVGYLANQYSTITLLSIFAAGCVVILGATHVLAGRLNPRLPSGEKWAILWFILCELCPQYRQNDGG